MWPWKGESPQQLLSNGSEKLNHHGPRASLFPLPRMLLLEAEFLPPCPLDLMNLIVPGNSLLDPNGSGNALLGQNLPRVSAGGSLRTSRGTPWKESRGHHGAPWGRRLAMPRCVMAARVSSPPP